MMYTEFDLGFLAPNSDALFMREFGIYITMKKKAIPVIYFELLIFIQMFNLSKLKFRIMLYLYKSFEGFSYF